MTAADTTSTFSYNPASQIVVRTRSNDAYIYGGDVARTLRYTANGLNQYATVGSATYAYDTLGRPGRVWCSAKAISLRRREG